MSAQEGPCRRRHAGLNGTAGATGRGFVAVPPDETVLKTAVGVLGPISAVVNVTRDDFRSYRSGVYRDEDCGGAAYASHAVLIVGYGTDDALGLDYWIVKNSWGAAWGDGGYALIARNVDDNCGIVTLASVPLL